MTSIEPPVTSETTLIDQLLSEQQSLTAVATFSQQHSTTDQPAQARYYQKLIPLAQPQKGEQYSFQVDLAACTGCKACVTACNSLNGLDPAETWRDTHLLVGGSDEQSLRQVITSACHHCEQPTCASGCPVLAYQKDPITGIVRHLDDQCIGCQYCILTCAYDVPKYNARLGIVRKCDMCQSRLAEGEAPACVQACPNEAIQIKIITRTPPPLQDKMLPGMAASSHSLPTTTYLGSEQLPADTHPAEQYQLTPEHGHSPLAWMLTLTQTSVGLFFGLFLFSQSSFFSNSHALPWMALAGLIIGLIGIAASVAHLGQPTKAWRCFLGLRHSWLSREIIAFGIWMPLAFFYTASFWLNLLTPVATVLGAATVLTGLLSIFCSVMVYAVTPRPFWSFPRTALRFFGTTLVTGLAGSLALLSWSGHSSTALSITLAIALIAKVTFDFSALLPLHTSTTWSPAKHTAMLQWHPLRSLLITRLSLPIIALLLLPLSEAPIATILIFITIFAAELAARSLFFRSVSTQ
ncbi:MAG: dimethyl sulfoxide reductase anchor subunit [Verrucomicrobiales bacterium]|nr:dimethyl sulfoxide reductase anchor subunit [Verrucomicrobiales bacterium]